MMDHSVARRGDDNAGTGAPGWRGTDGRRVGIVGCGVAGQAAAAMLADLGWRVEVFERASPLRPVGAGLLLQPTGQYVLARLGLLSEIVARSTRIDRLLGTTLGGRRVLDIGYGELREADRPGWPLCGLGITRGALFDTLQRRLGRGGVDGGRLGGGGADGGRLDGGPALEPGATARRGSVDVHPGVTVGSIEQSSRGPSAGGATTATIVGQAGERWGPFDLVLVCDGARSGLRPRWATSTAYDYGALWFVADDPGGEFGHTLMQRYDGTKRMVGFLPSGSPAPGRASTVSCFWSLPTDSIAHVKAAGLDAFCKQVLSMEPRARPLLDQLSSTDDLIAAHYTDAVTSPCYDGMVCYLGDAKHAMSPQLGQGANLALWDAMVLADLFAEAAPRQGASIGEPGVAGQVQSTLARFDRQRRRHTGIYRIASKWLTPWFQSDWSVLGPLRDACMLPASRIGWLRRQMLLSLAGVKSGWLTSMRVPRW